jgi:hypothetical protein
MADDAKRETNTDKKKKVSLKLDDIYEPMTV